MSMRAKPDGAAADGATAADQGVDAAVRALLVLMPRLVGRAKRIPVPEELRSLALTPRHLSLLSNLLFDGPLTVNELAARLQVEPTTASLLVGELNRKGVLERHEDEADRRRRIVSIADTKREVIAGWLARSATAWRNALAPLTPEQRRMFVETLRAYEAGMAVDDEG